jgi:cell division protein FtsB
MVFGCTPRPTVVLSWRVPKVEITGKPVARRRPPRLQRSAQARRLGRLLALFAAIVLIVDGLVGDRGFLAMLRARRQYAEISATLARQRADNARLREEARRLREDPGAIEELARRELGLIRPGEKVFIIKDLKPASTP